MRSSVSVGPSQVVRWGLVTRRRLLRDKAEDQRKSVPAEETASARRLVGAQGWFRPSDPHTE